MSVVRLGSTVRFFQSFFLLAFIAVLVSSTAEGFAQTSSTNIEVTGAPKQSSVNRIGITLGAVELEDAFQRQSKSRGLNPSVFRQELVSALKELHPGTIGMEFPDLSQQLAAKFSVSSVSVSGKSASGSEYGLGEFLQLCAEAGSDPWVRIPSGTTPEQMREVVEYLSGTGSDAWSAARIAAGQSEPWTEVFGKIHVELGSESQSGVTTSKPMEAEVYAERANADFGAARETAGFDNDKFDLMLSATGATTEWATAVLGQSREQDSVAIAADLPASAAGTSSTELYGALLAAPEATDSNGGVTFREVSALTGINVARSTSVNVGRSQLSSTTGGSEQLSQSWGAGLAQAENLLQMIALGARYQNGAVLNESSLHCANGSQTGSCRNSQFLSEALANGVIGGTMLQTIQTGVNPTWSQVVSDQTVQAHALQSFAFTEGGKSSLVVFNLSRTTALPVTFSGTNAPAGDVQMTQIAPSEITDSNQSGAELQPSTQTLSGSDLSGGLSVPPYSMTVLSWEAGSGVQTDASAAPETTKVTSATTKLSAANTFSVKAAASTSTSSSTTVFNCSSGFASSGSCGVALPGAGGQPFAVVGTQNGYNPSLSGTKVILAPSGADHTALSLNYQTLVNVQAFTASFTFIPNGQNIALVFNNSNNNPYFNGAGFSAGAGCEAGFFQAFSQPSPPNNVFAMELDDYSPLVLGGSFSGSSVQTYVSGISPCLPNDSGDNYPTTSKISTSPINMTTGSQNTTTGHVYSATVTYDGSNLTLNLYDVTAGGSCPGTSCFTNTWTGVNIPSAVGGNTAYVGFTEGTGTVVPTSPLYVNSFAYSTGASTSTAATPTFSVAAGTYTTAQSVSISDATSGATIYYTTNGTTPTTSSTKYSGAITVSSTETLEAIAVASGYSNSAVASATYTINQAAAATPTFSVAAGTYTTAQSVSINDATSEATIYYTTNGTTPTTSSTKYSGAITVSSSETLKAMAVASGYTNSAVASAAYTVNTTAIGTPVGSGSGTTYINYPNGAFSSGSFKLNGGATVTSSKVVELTDGGSQEARSAWFSSAVPVQNFTTDFTFQQLNANADGMTFTIQGQGSNADGDTGGGLGYEGITKSVAVKFDLYNNSGEGNDSTGLYTNGAAPTTPDVNLSSTAINLHSGDVMHAHLVYNGTDLTMTLTDTVTGGSVTEVFPVNIPSVVGSSTAYVGFTGGTGGKTSTQEVLSWTYTVPAEQTASTPTFSVAAGTYTSAQTVSISDATSGATIYYTTNGTTPTTSSTKYSGALTVSASETIEAIAVVTGYTNSPVATAAYTISATEAAVSAPAFSPAAGTYSTSQSVTISDATAGVTIYYTTDGSTPTTSSTKYTGALTVSASKTLKAIAVKAGTSNYPVASAAYTISSVLAAPTFSKAAGTYTSSQSVTISATGGTSIYYTTNGATPTTSSTKYSNPITVSATTTLKAIAVETGHTNSPVTSAAYTIAPVLAAPTFSKAAGTYTSSQSVTISATGGTSVYYTTNGATPTTSSTKYSNPITVSATTTLKAIAVETGHTNSPVTSAAYTIRATTAAAEAKSVVGED